MWFACSLGIAEWQVRSVMKDSTRHVVFEINFTISFVRMQWMEYVWNTILVLSKKKLN